MAEKQVAVLARRNQAEALRVAGGLTLADHAVEVFVLDHPLADSPEVAEQLEVLEIAEVAPVPVAEGAGTEGAIAPEELAKRLTGFEAVLAI